MKCSWARWISLLAFACSVHAHEGWGVVVHPRLGVVVSDIPANTIWRFKSGRVEALAREVHSHALIAGDGGAIFGTDANEVWQIDATGRFTTLMQVDPQIGLQSFLITPDRTIHSANTFDHRNPKVNLMRRDANGAVTTVATGFTGIDGIREHEGAIVIADGAFLRAVAPDGRVSTIAGPLTQRSLGEDLLGLSSIRDGAIHVADIAGRRILKVRLSDGATEVVDRSDFWWAPSGVEVTEDGIYILEHLRPPLALLGDMGLGPYLRVRRGNQVLGVVWGRRTWAAVLIAIAVVTAAAVLVRIMTRSAGLSGAR